MNSPNRDALVRVARLLGPIAGELVFVGGRVAELLVTEPGSTRVRPTSDSDAVCEVATRPEYYRLGERLRAAGFTEDRTPGAPICRWRHGEEILDVLPVDGAVLGFRNAWYVRALVFPSGVGWCQFLVPVYSGPPTARSVPRFSSARRIAAGSGVLVALQDRVVVLPALQRAQSCFYGERACA